MFLHINTAGNNQFSIDSYQKYFLPRVKIETYNIEIDGKNFYDQPINDLTKQYAYFERNYKLIAVDLSKEIALDADSRAIKQIIFTGKIKAKVANTRVTIHYILEQSKETKLKFAKGTTKVLLLHING